MLYQPFLPEVASGLIDPRAVVVPLRQVLRRTELVLGEVDEIDLHTKRASVLLIGGEQRELAYDVVILGAGSWSRTLPIPGLAEHGVGFKTLAEAIWLRNRVLSQLDRAAELTDTDARRAATSFVFVGAGFAGIEALGELEDLARVAAGKIPAVDRSEQRWVMVRGRSADPAGARPRARGLCGGAASRARYRHSDVDAARADRRGRRPPVRRRRDPRRDGGLDGRRSSGAARLELRVPGRRARPRARGPCTPCRRRRWCLGGG